LFDSGSDTADNTAGVFAAELDGFAVKVAQAFQEDYSTVTVVAAWEVDW
jgi:hypothetical protein